MRSSRSPTEPLDPERLVVGRIAKAHGINGEVSIDVISDAPDRFAAGARVFAGDRSLTVTDEKGETLGTMTRVDESPGADLWVVGARGREVLVPAVREIVVAVDLDERRIVLRPPDGLF